MSKTTIYHPKYQLRAEEGSPLYEMTASFPYNGIFFLTTIKRGFWGLTETQRSVLQWASWQGKTPPVMSIKHGKPGKPDRKSFVDPNELHRVFYPYAMNFAELICLGENKPRKVKVYFCEAELHEDNAYAHIHRISKGWNLVFPC